VITRLAAGLGILLVLVTVTPLTSWWAGALGGTPDPPGRVLIVLGGSTIEGGVIGRSSYWRAVYASWAWERGGVERIVVSGASAGPPIAKFLEASGVPAEAITVEDRSSSTLENARETARLLADDPRPKTLLTSDYHMWRAERCFAAQGMDVARSPVPDAGKRAASWMHRWDAFLELSVETWKILGYLILGRL